MQQLNQKLQVYLMYDSPDFTPHWNVDRPDTFHAIAPFQFYKSEWKISSLKNQLKTKSILSIFSLLHVEVSAQK
jgi:hypothetical protein